MHEKTGVIEGSTVTYVVKNLLDLMKDALASAAKADQDAQRAQLYAEQVDLEYTLTHALRDVDRLEHEIRALQDEKRQRLRDVAAALEQSKGRLREAQRVYVTVEDVHDSRQDFEEARADYEVAAQKRHTLEEQLWTARQEEEMAAQRSTEAEKAYVETRARLEEMHKKGSLPHEVLEEHHKARTEHRKLNTRLELERADIEKDYAAKILDLRKQQAAVAADAKQSVVAAEKRFAKQPAALEAGNGAAVIPMKPAAGTK